MRISSYYARRTLCEVFDAMRTCSKTGNYSYLPGLVEEAQVMADRMEAGLGHNKDLDALETDVRRYKHQLADLRKEIISLGAKPDDGDDDE